MNTWVDSGRSDDTELARALMMDRETDANTSSGSQAAGLVLGQCYEQSRLWTQREGGTCVAAGDWLAPSIHSPFHTYLPGPESKGLHFPYSLVAQGLAGNEIQPMRCSQRQKEGSLEQIRLLLGSAGVAVSPPPVTHPEGAGGNGR